MNVCLALALLALAALALPADAAPESSPAKVEPEMLPIQDDPKLPRVLLIGDSISIGYTLPVRKALAGKANIHRIPTNGGDTANGLAHFDDWLGKGHWDVIHFNFGLHDMKIAPGNKHQVEPEQYEKNLRQIVARLKKTNAKLIFATTTPVPDGTQNPVRRKADVPVYNALALKVMQDNAVTINDLYTFIAPKLADTQRPANVHFTDRGYQALATQVTAALQSALGLSPATQPK